MTPEELVIFLRESSTNPKLADLLNEAADTIEKLAGLVDKKKRKPYKISEFDDEIDSKIAIKFTDALHANHGNFTHTGQALGFTRQRAHEIAKRLGLIELAAQLREENGQPRRGRSRKATKK